MRARAVSAAVVLVLLAGALVARAEAMEAGLLHAMRLTPAGGAAPPPLALRRLADGRTLTLGDLRGRPVLLYFWATW